MLTILTKVSCNDIKVELSIISKLSYIFNPQYYANLARNIVLNGLFTIVVVKQLLGRLDHRYPMVS